ncbi:M15 family metallopeptidase [Microbacterium sulfonylureivorans]|uniref:M15 family metallopeptidase n=1 Tax=Microbacterium sulfonylureivorans TaxID=2486854 RepID=UPI000FDA4B4C|nr:M15 family metallopeptidase [Microbacterium sulfonylureivorans]
MSTSSSRTSPRRIRLPFLVVITTVVAVAVAAIAGIVGSASSTAIAGPTTADAPAHTQSADATAGETRTQPAAPPLDGQVALEDGGLGDGATVYDELPAISNLETRLIDAVRRAASVASADGVAFSVNSGWRSAQYQGMLLDDAVAEYGSADEAARWVATPETSPHVRGEAIDMGGDAAAWLSAHGAAYGLCQIYANEPWHYELREEAVDGGCPTMYPDPTYDPRMG